MKISLIKPYEKNAKKHPTKQIRQVADSIREFGFNQPIVVDKNNVIIVGHGRLEAAKLLGLDDVPVITVDLTEDKAKAYRLADNKLNESDWDMELVIEELKGLSPIMLDLTGFNADLIIDKDNKDDVVPENVPAQSKLGDLYELGPHRLLCGDSTKPEEVDRLMNGHKADMVFTDPPYNINYKGSKDKKWNEIDNDNLPNGEFSIFLDKIFKNYSLSLKTGGGMYVFHDQTTQSQFEEAITKNKFFIKSQLIWNKPYIVLGMGDYRRKHEPIFYCSMSKDTVFYGDRSQAIVIDFHKTEQELLALIKSIKKAEVEGKTTIWTMKRDPVQDYVHPTQKPVELITYAIFNSSKKDDLILDLFGGSGSTLIASEKMGRVCNTMEYSPTYVDVIVQRYVDYTGNEEIIKNGKKIIWKKSEVN